VTPSNTFAWAHPSPYPNVILISSATFAGLTNVTDRETHTCRQTDRPTNYTPPSVRIGRTYVHSTAMRSNNNNTNYPLSVQALADTSRLVLYAFSVYKAISLDMCMLSQQRNPCTDWKYAQ